MFRLALTSSCALFWAGAAPAADLPRPAPPAAPTITPYHWTGFYLGLSAGYGFTQDKTTATGSRLIQRVIQVGESPAVFHTGTNGLTGGGQVGFNYQFTPYLVAGIEADYHFANLQGREDVSRQRVFPPLRPEPVVSRVSAGLHSLGTVRARLGFTPVERLLVYVTGGLAYGEVKSQHAMDALLTHGGSFTGASHGYRTGWAAGAGIEWAVLDNVTIRAEYLHYDLGSIKTGSLDRVVRQPHWGLTRSSFSGDVIRVGFNVRF